MSNAVGRREAGQCPDPYEGFGPSAREWTELDLLRRTKASCAEKRPKGFTCTRERDHQGFHVAHGSRTLAVWARDNSWDYVRGDVRP